MAGRRARRAEPLYVAGQLRCLGINGFSIRSYCPAASRCSRSAALYITKLPKAEHNAKEWQVATEALLQVAEHDGPTMFAQIGVIRALHRHEPMTVSAPRAKAYKSGRLRSLSHATRHKAADRDLVVNPHRPDHRASCTVRFGDHRVVGDIDPVVLKPNPIVAVL
jgi:hypothetical protein